MTKTIREKIRLYVEHPLGAGQSVPLSREQAHYLFGVMRLKTGAGVALFNGTDGEWRAQVVEAGKRGGVLHCDAQSAPLMMPPDLWLIFAPIKKARTDFIVEKAAEMGVRRILPVITEYTNSARLNIERLQAHAVEAAEQCGGTFVPQVAQAVKFGALIDGWDAARSIMFCDETQAGPASSLPAVLGGSSAVLIGPEGGFAPRERSRLAACTAAHAIALGPRILRADTAAVAALTLWQNQLGDWSKAT